MKHLLLSLSLLIAASSASAQEYLAAYKFEKGKSYKYVQETKTEMTQEFSGQTMNMTIDGTMTTSMLINDILPNGNFKVKNTIESAIIMMESQMGNQVMGKDFVGKSFEFELKPDGYTIKSDSMFKDAKPQEMQVLEKAVEFLPKLSGSTVELGSKWEVESVDTVGNGQFVQKSKTTYVVKEKKNLDGIDCLIIDADRKQEISGSGSQGGAEFNISGEGKIKTTITFAIAERMVTLVNVDATEEQIITVPSQGNMRIPITTHSVSKIELAK